MTEATTIITKTTHKYRFMAIIRRKCAYWLFKLACAVAGVSESLIVQESKWDV